jgi:hypothetical protein
MPEFKLFGGPRHGKIVEIDNPFVIERWMAPSIRDSGIEYDVYTRREFDGILFFAFSELNDEQAVKILVAA